MNNFIQVTDYDATIHREILDSLLREDAGSSATIEVCENRAIATVRALISSRYDCDLSKPKYYPNLTFYCIEYQ